MVPHLLVAISSHGFGHVAQVAPVVNALRAQLPELRLTLRTAAPRALLDARIHGPFQVQPVADDFGMVQHSALVADTEASAERYRVFHQQWEGRVIDVADALSSACPDLILADVPYLTLAGAAHAGIPSVALCSLHWADIYRHYCGTRPEAPAILAQMQAAYISAEVFLRPTPSMPMDDLPNRRAIGPVAAAGVNRRARLADHFGLRRSERLVLVSLGGIATRLAAERWPRMKGVRWIFQRDWAVDRDDALVLEESGMSFSDVLASCDLLLTKPGYGSFVEAAAAGVPVLYVARDEWPESAFLTDWLHHHGRCAAVTHACAESGDFSEEMSSLLGLGRFPPLPMSGVDEAAEMLAALL